MPSSKRIIINVPESLLSEVDAFTVFESKNRSEIVRDAIKYYLGERKKELMIEQMKKGYLEMAAINLQIATENSGLEDEAQDKCEEKQLE